jgi:hypothetical protein
MPLRKDDEMSEEASGFTVKDRRRFNDEAEPVPTEPTATPGPEAESSHAGPETVTEAKPAASDTEEGASTEDDNEQGRMPEISTMGILQFTLGTLAQMAWQHMGLVANPASGKIEVNMDEARLAIDAVGALSPVVEARSDSASRREIQATVTNLRINFVEQQRRRGTGA